MAINCGLEHLQHVSDAFLCNVRQHRLCDSLLLDAAVRSPDQKIACLLLAVASYPFSFLGQFGPSCPKLSSLCFLRLNMEKKYLIVTVAQRRR